MESPTLVDRMRDWCDRHPDAPETPDLRTKATKLEAATLLVDDSPESVKSLLGAWARARLAWCYVTGEPLI